MRDNHIPSVREKRLAEQVRLGGWGYARPVKRLIPSQVVATPPRKIRTLLPPR